MKIEKMEGLVAATFSNFDSKGSLKLSDIPSLVDKLYRDGLKGVFVCGTNGEGPNLTLAERMLVAERYVNAAKNKLKVFVHVGHSAIAEARELAIHAEQIGADAISAVAAFYFRPVDTQNLVDCMAQIANAAPTLPFYYYHIPTLTGVGMDMVKFLELAEEKIPNLAGIKYTASTLYEYQACLNYKGGKYDMLFGYDEMLLPALALGAKGAVGSTYNFAAPLYLRMMDLYKYGQLEKAQELQYHLVQMIRAFVKYSPIPAQKAIMQMFDLDMGGCRLPLQGLRDEQKETLKNELDNLGFFHLLKTGLRI
ncbi:dihydrodipicolinate synthase family protein [Olivibacter sp. SDN3]|uniref:dihydrodipicolinate synthase family protein n=1 Tax=Olivibacter sp. SDN3 TaxID=2764720 RepID=UPI0016518B8D|nr:dihydrodipicolinate synthase family protein [Olivibacter sp. SDN3]QNL48283.1 dihydrodipicolinate synthase family protein [Olivibacter sp. SDN3]